MLLEKHIVGKDGMKVLVVTHRDTVEGVIAAWVAKRFLKDAMIWKGVPSTAGPEVYQVDKFEKGLEAHQLLIVGVHMTSATYKALAGRVKAIKVLTNDFDTKLESGSLKIVKYHKMALGALVWQFFGSDEARPWLVDWSDDSQIWRWPSHNYARMQDIFLHGAPGDLKPLSFEAMSAFAKMDAVHLEANRDQFVKTPAPTNTTPNAPKKGGLKNVKAGPRKRR